MSRRARTPQQWANYWRERAEIAEDNYNALLEPVTRFLDAWQVFVRNSGFNEEFFEDHYDAALSLTLRDLVFAVATVAPTEANS